MEKHASQTSGELSEAGGGRIGNHKDLNTPFKLPTDEEVFITRETEKQKRKEAKEKAKNLKIWDKKTATSRLPLKRFKDSDIPAQSTDEIQYNFGPKKRECISTAMHIAKSRVQFPKEKGAQNATEFVDQKKEMFLVELAYKTIKNEIDELRHKAKRKDIALQDSTDQLERDSFELMKFIERDDMRTAQLDKEAEMMQSKRKKKETKLKNIENEIANKKSDIEKNRDILTSLSNHKDFLVDLSSREWLQEQEEKRSKKLAMVKKAWIEEQKSTPKEGNVLFKEEEDQRKDGKRFNNSQRRTTMTQAEWEAKFDQLLAEDLIDVPEDYYEEQIQFTDPSDLSKIFSDLEERNLFLIHNRQEAEQSLEELKNEQELLQKKLGKEAEIHMQSKKELEDNIMESKRQLAEIRKRSQLTSELGKTTKTIGGINIDEMEQEIDVDEILQQMRKEISSLYRKAIDQNADLQAKQNIDLLVEIEIKLDEYIKEQQYIRKVVNA